MQYYVDRDINGAVDGLYRNKQYDGQEKLKDDHADILTYLGAQDNDDAKSNKLSQIENHLIDLFDFIDELFTIGRQKGLWKPGDFTPEILQKGQAWRQKINEYKAM